MPGQKASIAQFPVDDRFSPAGNLDSEFHGISGDEPKRKPSLDGICLWWQARERKIFGPLSP
jgi:hypothetical protein